MRGVQSLQQAFYKTASDLKHHAPTILTCVGAVGVVATSVLTAKATTKASILLKEAEAQKGEELTKTEMLITAAPAYIPAVAVGVSTMACIFGANVLNKKKQASLISAYGMIDQTFKRYKHKVEELYGEGSDEEIRHAIADDNFVEVERKTDDTLLFYDEYSNRYFWKTMDEVKDAEYHFNRNFVLRGYAELNEFYEFLELEPTAYGATVGWSMEAGGAFYGYTWVDFYHEYHESEDPDAPSYYTIHMPFGPTADFMSY